LHGFAKELEALKEQVQQHNQVIEQLYRMNRMLGLKDPYDISVNVEMLKSLKVVKQVEQPIENKGARMDWSIEETSAAENNKKTYLTSK
jgi:hypothetical protein